MKSRIMASPPHRIEQCRSIAARFSEMKQRSNRLLGHLQLTTNDARGGQPEHNLETLGVDLRGARTTHARERRSRLLYSRLAPRSRSGRVPKRTGKSSSRRSFSDATSAMSQSLDTALRVRDCLEIGGADGSFLAGLQPIALRPFDSPASVR